MKKKFGINHELMEKRQQEFEQAKTEIVQDLENLSSEEIFNLVAAAFISGNALMGGHGSVITFVETYHAEHMWNKMKQPKNYVKEEVDAERLKCFYSGRVRRRMRKSKGDE